MSVFHRPAKLAVAMAVTAMFVGVATPAAADQISDGQWFHALMKISAAHRLTEGAGVTVAVIDTGVDAAHPDLAGSVLTGADFTEEGPGDGRTDSYGHGTAMAGLIVAHGRVKGVAPAAKILPVRTSVSSSGGGGLARGIIWATEQQVDVISISRMVLDDDIVVREAVEAALAADIVVVAPTGNRSESTRMSHLARISGVVAVGGVDRKGGHSKISVSGAETLLAAPCDEISSTYPGAKWGVTTGTSSSTALVAGAAALIRAKFPDLSAADVIHRLTATAIDKGFRGPDGEYGYGIVDVLAALTKDVMPQSLAPSPSLDATASSYSPQPEREISWPRALVPIMMGAFVIVLVLAMVVSRRRARR
ncbi:S8 family serine peptidase [Catellatospora sp. NPDC049609]|uniref:S8 family serine peptidase n=1 Tax=Catellatospora sp. NPDC049609 TaxID=3155505 RepID=UPI0034250A85